MRRVTCRVCGASISAPVGADPATYSSEDWALVAGAVRRHNDSARHATDPTVAALRARLKRQERLTVKAELDAVRLRRRLRVVA